MLTPLLLVRLKLVTPTAVDTLLELLADTESKMPKGTVKAAVLVTPPMLVAA